MSESADKNYRSLVVSSYEKLFNEKVEEVKIIPQAGSERYYFRIQAMTQKVIACFYNNEREKEAFVSYTKHFHSLGLHVPEFLREDDDLPVYFVEDLGDQQFADTVFNRKADRLGPILLDSYKSIIKELIRFQLDGIKDLDLSCAYPRADFDQRSLMWDLNYFKYYYLKIHMDFDEELLENDFEGIANYLMQVDSSFFMSRDFQSRNILQKDGQFYFIDYQGGRRGPLQYDLVSLLFQAKALIPADQRDMLLDYYLENLSLRLSVDEKKFKEEYLVFVLLRTLQVLGAYGFRGLIQQKTHFLESIPMALNNLRWVLENWPLPGKWNYLYTMLASLLYKAKS